MTVHMFRVFASVEGMTLSEFQDAIDDWVAEHTKWDEDPTEPTVYVVNAEIYDDNTVYRRGDFRFERDDTKDNIVQKLEDKLVNKLQWYRVGYHECTHDQSDPSPCSWDDTKEWADKGVTIPDYVPTFDIS